ncbi:zinc dependent phospholipase C family protein [Candidatus Woesearchaeota archaeon]|nr:zinc dependent phospholipase C family protein [Candidatus Woesearchaeota archaeon]
MPQPITHYHVIENAFQRTPELRHLWDRYSNYATLGSILPDLFYFSGVPGAMPFWRHGKIYAHDYYKASDIIHLEGFLDFYLNMMDIINELPEGDKKDKLKAFAYGATSHYITDANVHPFVYSKTGDNPFTHYPDSRFSDHKSLEKLVDLERLGHRNVTYFDFDYDKKLECHEQGSNRTLDQEVFRLIVQSMNKTYADIFGSHGINYDLLFGSLEGKPEHPVLESYRDAISIYRHLSNHPLLVRVSGYVPFLPRRFKVLLPQTKIVATDLHKTKPEPPEPWIRHSSRQELVPALSVPELIEMSVLDTMIVMHETEGFFKSDKADYKRAQDYFKANTPLTPFLRSNINMDTGKPSELNDSISSRSTPEEMFIEGLETLVERFNQPRAALTDLN